MDTVQSWLDAKEVRRLAEGLMEPSHEKEYAASEAGYGEKFEGYTGPDSPEGDVAATGDPEPASESVSSPRASVSNALADARRVAEGCGMLQLSQNGPVEVVEKSSSTVAVAASEKVVSKVISKAKVSDLDLSQLQRASKQWASQFSFQSMVLMGRDEELAFDSLGNAMLTGMAVKLAKAVPTSGHLFVKVGAAACLQVISLATVHGVLTLGVQVPAPLSSDQIAELAELVAQDVASLLFDCLG